MIDVEWILIELNKGAASWNKWRKGFTPQELILDGLQLSNMNLDGFDFSKLSLRNACFRHCSLRQADLISANLEGAFMGNNDFTQAKLIAARLIDCDLSGSILQGANLLTVVTRNTKLEDINFKGIDMTGLVLRNISLARSQLSGQSLAHLDFSNSNLEGVNFTGANLTGAIFNGCRLAGARLHNAKLTGASFKQANLSSANLSGADATKTDFSGAHLTNIDLRGATIIQSKFTRAEITGAKLWNVQTSQWRLVGIQCEYAFWDEAGKERTVYLPHEFERIFAEALSIELRYPYRLSDHELATLPIFIEHLAAVHWGIILRLKSISDVAGGALVKIAVEEIGTHNPSELKQALQVEAERIQLAQLMLRSNTQMHLQLKEKIGAIREEFWPRLLELAVDHEKDQTRNLTILFMDLKGFSTWTDAELSEKLSLFRGLVKPVLNKWGADHPNMEGDSLRVTFKNATAGLSCACMLRDVLNAADFQLRIGVELGEVQVVHNEITNVPDLEGTAVSMAARMEAAAEPGEVLVSHRVRHYAERSNLFNFMPRSVALKKGIGTLEQGELVECFAVDHLATREM